MLEGVFKKNGLSIIGIVLIVIWAIIILTIMLSIISKSSIPGT